MNFLACIERKQNLYLKKKSKLLYFAEEEKRIYKKTRTMQNSNKTNKTISYILYTRITFDYKIQLYHHTLYCINFCLRASEHQFNGSLSRLPLCVETLFTYEPSLYNTYKYTWRVRYFSLPKTNIYFSFTIGICTRERTCSRRAGQPVRCAAVISSVHQTSAALRICASLIFWAGLYAGLCAQRAETCMTVVSNIGVQTPIDYMPFSKSVSIHKCLVLV